MQGSPQNVPVAFDLLKKMIYNIFDIPLNHKVQGIKKLLPTCLQLQGLCDKYQVAWTQRNLSVPASSLTHLRMISNNGRCLGNGRSVNLLTEDPESKVGSIVSLSLVADGIPAHTSALLSWRNRTPLRLTNASSFCFDSCCTLVHQIHSPRM